MPREQTEEPRRKRVGLTAIGGALVLALVVAWAVWSRGVVPGPAGAAVAPEPEPVPEAGSSSAPLTDDPAADGWESEVVSGRIEESLKQIAKWLADPTAVSAPQLHALASDRFRSGTLRPTSLAPVFEGAPFRVERAATTEPDGSDHQGPEGFEEALRALRSPFAEARAVRAEVKLFRVDLSGDSIVTSNYLSLSGIDSEGPVEEHSTWSASWTREDRPRLQSLEIEDYERSRAKAEGPLFRDSTESVLGYPITADQLLGRGLPHWYQRIEMRLGQSPLGYHGLSLADVDGDGLEDLYLANPGGLPNRLYVQNADGTVTERSAAAGVDWMERTASSLFVDLDNDGDQDLVVGTTPQIVMENDGEGHFVPRQTLRGVAVATSMVAADPDGDGDLDLYVCNYSSSGPVPIHDANNGPPNTLWRNDGDWSFTDATQESGLGENNSRFSFAAAWEDHDNDGDLDLYVANDYGRNNLYENDGTGKFRDVAAQAGVEDISAGMSVTFGDYDLDGWMDLYVSNMFSSAGNRITYQRQFNPAARGTERTNFQRHARGNSLFRGGPGGGFTDVSVEAGVTMGRWAWTSLFVDLDNDGFPDLITANGNLTNESPKDL